MKDSLFWYDFISGVCSTILIVSLFIGFFFLVGFVSNKFKLDDVWLSLIACLLMPIVTVFLFQFVPYVRFLDTEYSVPTVMYTSRGGTIIPSLANIPIGTILGVSFTFGAIWLVIRFLTKK